MVTHMIHALKESAYLLLVFKGTLIFLHQITQYVGTTDPSMSPLKKLE